MGNRGDSDGRRKKRRQESASSVNVDRGYLKNRKEAEREDQCAQGLSINCREIMSPMSRLIKGICNKYHRSSLGRDNASSIEWLLLG